MSLLMFSSMAAQAPKVRARLELEALLLRAARGEAQAVGEIYEETRGAVYGFSLSILRNAHDAEDVLQETYIRVFENSASYKPNGNPMPWILQIAKNLSLMRLRQRKRQEPMPEEDVLLPETLTLPEDRLVLRAALETMDDQERQIVSLHALAGFKHREIAAFLHSPLSTVLSRYQRAIKKLQKRLEEEGA